MGLIRKLISKIRSSLYVFKKAEIAENIVRKEINGEYDNLCGQCLYHERARPEQPSQGLRLAIYLGGALGDYIVYLRFVDEISSICDCEVDLFLDKIEFAQFVYGHRQNVKIVHDVHNNLFVNFSNQYDLALHLDHGVTLRHSNLNEIQAKSPDFYATACKILEYTKSHTINISEQHQRETVILRQAKFFGETKWSKLSCGGAIDMQEMYSNILLDAAFMPVLSRYQLLGRKYITVNYGADKNMGGTAQTKVLPVQTLLDFVAQFKQEHPDYAVVQTGVRNSYPLEGADRYAFDCRLEETAILLKYSACHVDCEGGLVHLASQLSTPCAVSFGPTPSYYYGYPRNKNIVSSVCSDCMATTNRWSVVCPRGLQRPECMASITSEQICSKVDEILSGYTEKKQEIRMCQKPEDKQENVQKDLANQEIIAYYCSSLRGKTAGMRIGWITEFLDVHVFKAAQQLYQKGNHVTIFVGTDLKNTTIRYRTQLKKMGVAVEYGDFMNIARPEDSYDIVCCEASPVLLETEAYMNELRRVTVEEGAIILWT